jgi:hypothetical protein
MRKCYLLVHSVRAASHDQMKNILSSIPEVITWRTDIPRCFYVISEKSAAELTSLIRSKTSKLGRFIVSEIGDNRNGWLTGESWYLIKNRKLKPPA